MIQYIRSQIPREELLAQLAEESTELAHAALKLRRSIDGTNPTPVTEEQAMENLREEVADVLLILEDLLDIDPLDIEIDSVRVKKIERWYNRLQDAAGRREAEPFAGDIYKGCPF